MTLTYTDQDNRPITWTLNGAIPKGADKNVREDLDQYRKALRRIWAKMTKNTDQNR